MQHTSRLGGVCEQRSALLTDAPTNGGDVVVSCPRDARAMSSLDLFIDSVAVRQHGVITRAQFLERGSKHQLDRRLQCARLVRLYDSVYRVPSVPGTWQQQ